jgi:hypothetical protein
MPTHSCSSNSDARPQAKHMSPSNVQRMQTVLSVVSHDAGGVRRVRARKLHPHSRAADSSAADPGSPNSNTGAADSDSNTGATHPRSNAITTCVFVARH